MDKPSAYRRYPAQPGTADGASLAQPGSSPSLGFLHSQTQHALDAAALGMGLVADDDPHAGAVWDLRQYDPTWVPAATDPWPSPYRDAVELARLPDCPNTYGFYLVNLDEDTAFPMACKGWGCPVCSRRRARAARLLFERGMVAAVRRNERLRFMTLTDDAPGTMTVPELGRCWNRLRGKLVRKGLLRDYAMVVEFQQRGALHIHAVCTGEFIPQRKLASWAKDAGWGAHAHIAEVKSVLDVATYSLKAASYATKAMSSAEAMRKKGATRVRPIRTSTGWLPGGLRAIEEELRIRPSGKSEARWAKVRVMPDGSITLVAEFGR